MKKKRTIKEVKQEVNPMLVGTTAALITGGIALTGMAVDAYGKHKQNKGAKEAADRNARNEEERLAMGHVSGGGEITNNGGIVNPYAMAMGGPAPEEGAGDPNLQKFDGGDTHENSPTGGTQIGMGENGKPITIEKGESAVTVNINGTPEKFIFTNRVPYTLGAEGLPKWLKGDTYSDAAKNLEKAFEDRYDKYSMDTKKALYNRLAIHQQAATQGLTDDQVGENPVDQNQGGFGGTEDELGKFGNYSNQFGGDSAGLINTNSNLYNELPNVAISPLDKRIAMHQQAGTNNFPESGAVPELKSGEIDTGAGAVAGGGGSGLALGIGLGTQALGIASNIYNMSQLNKSEVDSPALVSKKDLNPFLVNRSSILNRIDQGAATADRALVGGSGGSRAALVAGQHANRVASANAISEAMLASNVADNAERARIQQLNVGVDTTNAQIIAGSNEINSQNYAAYEGQRAAYVQAIGANIGGMGQNLMNHDIAKRSADYMGIEARLKALEV